MLHNNAKNADDPCIFISFVIITIIIIFVVVIIIIITVAIDISNSSAKDSWIYGVSIRPYLLFIIPKRLGII